MIIFYLLIIWSMNLFDWFSSTLQLLYQTINALNPNQVLYYWTNECIFTAWSTSLLPPKLYCKVTIDWLNDSLSCKCQHNFIRPKSNIDDSGVLAKEQQQSAWPRDGVLFSWQTLYSLLAWSKTTSYGP